MMAVIQTGGKQYLVREGQELMVEKLEANVGDNVALDTLMVSDAEGTKVDVGTPMLAKQISATVVEHGRGEKVEIIKYKPKVRYRRHTGHRQPFTKIKIGAIA